ncbi:SipW-dependent-type signal peptide-containing protein [Longibaculum muris]|uniref:SipW-dependent-type signal peptide-containing protein n=1 Tax=Longibaculum muris TaxID=1796628 RepID=UPI0022E62FDA|nr:SipW-dependent-type signal peptide-containing protein [Longibaculum muris]
MKKKKLTTLVAGLALVGAVAFGATLAYFTDSDNATNTITMGHVDIDLTEPNYPGGEEGGKIENVVPNQDIKKDPTITLVDGSEDAYVRAKIEYKFDGQDMPEEMVKELEANIDVLSNWVKGEDGYLYFQYKLTSENNSVKLFTHVVIPEKWGNEVADKSIEIKVSAEAIQANSFEPTRDELNEIVAWSYEDGTAITPETYKAQ